jgi:hypothetical protein
LADIAARAAAVPAALPATFDPAAIRSRAFAVAGAASLVTFAAALPMVLVALRVFLPTSRSGLVNNFMSRWTWKLANAIQ